MATFQFASRQVELEFPGGIKHTLPLTEEMRQTVESAAKELKDKASALRGRAGTSEDMDELCDCMLDAVDAILGDGAADQIMEIKGDYSFLDCSDLFKFVTEEFTSAFIREATAARAKVGAAPRSNQQKPPVSAPNRAQRRRNRRNH